MQADKKRLSDRHDMHFRRNLIYIIQHSSEEVQQGHPRDNTFHPSSERLVNNILTSHLHVQYTRDINILSQFASS